MNLPLDSAPPRSNYNNNPNCSGGYAYQGPGRRSLSNRWLRSFGVVALNGDREDLCPRLKGCMILSEKPLEVTPHKELAVFVRVQV